MRKPFIFVSCGQFTEAEKRLGKQIVAQVETLTEFTGFFAEEVQDLNGLDANILRALRECDGFITVLHPRGKIVRPDQTVVTRASVWIEQEIAIATYIQRVEERPLPIIAFKHKDVSREGIRELLHLNPIEFETESDVLAKLPERLIAWKSLKPRGRIELVLSSASAGKQDDHAISRLDLNLVNDAPKPIEQYECKICIPASILAHWSASYSNEVMPREDPNVRCFRFSERNKGIVGSRDRRELFSIQYCMHCASQKEGIAAKDREATAIAWIEGTEYEVRKTMEELAKQR